MNTFSEHLQRIPFEFWKSSKGFQTQCLESIAVMCNPSTACNSEKGFRLSFSKHFGDILKRSGRNISRSILTIPRALATFATTKKVRTIAELWNFLQAHCVDHENMLNSETFSLRCFKKRFLIQPGTSYLK